jgi:NitT/TauT family transport system substrate-binding protein
MNFMLRRMFLSLAMLLAGAMPAFAEATFVRIGRAPGLAFLPLFVMEAGKLLEKHLALNGLRDVTVVWQEYTSGNVMNDALLSGNMEFANGGLPPFLTLWAKARDTRNEIGALAAVSDMPSVLTTNNPNVRSLRDFTDKDRISVASVKASQVAILLQMAAEKEFGPGEFARLDPLTVTMPQSETVTALLSGRTEITAHFTVPPFSNRELKDPKIKVVLRSIDILGGVNTNIVAYTTKAFRDANRKTVKAYRDALDEASATVANDPKQAAAFYLQTSRDKIQIDELIEILGDPALRYSLAPSGTMVFAEFMYKAGSIKVKPAGWKDLFFEEAHHLPGS